MARYEFKFVVSDVQLAKEHEERIGQAVAQAAALALAQVTPDDAVTIKFGANQWWRGRPPEALLKQLQEAAAQSAGG